MTDKTRPRGALAAVVTPFTDALEPNHAALIAHCRWLLRHGCTGLAILATAGEANSLSAAQRIGIVEAVAATIPMNNVIVGGGSCALAEAVALTRAITEAGAGGTLLLPPFFYRDPDEEGIYAFYAAVIERIGDPGLRLYLHHRPQASGAPITGGLVARLRSAFGGIIAGVQNGAGDWPTTAALLEAFPDLDVFSGTERFLLANLRAGGPGCIAATLNVTAPLVGPILAAPASAAAATAQKELTAMRLIFDRFPIPQGPKEILAQLTGDPGWRTLVPPLRPLDAEARGALTQSLEALPPMARVRAAAGA
jgi:4-hydroxy-tetrahydrodipicolinate synthase